MSQRTELENLIANPLISETQRAEAKALLDALDNPVVLVPEPTKTPSQIAVAKMLAQHANEELNGLTDTRTPQQLWDENFRIVALEDAEAANPKGTGNDHDIAAAKLRKDPAWLAKFEATYGRDPSAPPAPPVATAPVPVAVAPAPKPKPTPIWAEVTKITRPTNSTPEANAE